MDAMDLISKAELSLAQPLDLELFTGCCVEAERADVVSLRLEGLRLALQADGDSHLTATIGEMKTSSRYLRELADLSQVYQDRVPIVLDLLHIILPSLQRTLRAVTTYYDDQSVSKKNRWRALYHSMKDEGLALPQRFTLYNFFLICLRDVLKRSSNFDLNKFETYRSRVLQLREEQGLAPPTISVNPRLGINDLVSPLDMDPTLHWAEQIFTLPLTSRTALKTMPIRSFSPGPHKLWGHLRITDNPKILFRRSFNDDQLSIAAFLDGRDRNPHLLLRVLNKDPGVQPFFSIRGVHELVIERDASSLRLMRWSYGEQCAKLWAQLFFQTWEELILVYCTFLALKARNTLTVRVNPEEWLLKGERKLFQARIADDGFRHSLIVYEDRTTGGLRLHAAVWDGELRQCPVWTAFVTHQSASETWMKRISRRRIRLADVQPYVFCQEYRQQTQRRGQAGTFEIQFYSEEACIRFQELFPRKSRAKTPDPAADEPGRRLTYV